MAEAARDKGFRGPATPPVAEKPQLPCRAGVKFCTAKSRLGIPVGGSRPADRGRGRHDSGNRPRVGRGRPRHRLCQADHPAVRHRPGARFAGSAVRPGARRCAGPCPASASHAAAAWLRRRAFRRSELIAFLVADLRFRRRRLGRFPASLQGRPGRGGEGSLMHIAAIHSLPTGRWLPGRRTGPHHPAQPACAPAASHPRSRNHPRATARRPRCAATSTRRRRSVYLSGAVAPHQHRLGNGRVDAGPHRGHDAQLEPGAVVLLDPQAPVIAGNRYEPVQNARPPALASSPIALTTDFINSVRVPVLTCPATAHPSPVPKHLRQRSPSVAIRVTQSGSSSPCRLTDALLRCWQELRSHE